MPISPAILVEVKAPATRYRMIIWKFGGDEPTLKDAGFGEYDYIAGIILGPNPALLLDRVGGCGYYAVERAGFYQAADTIAAWQWLLRNYKEGMGNVLITLNQNKHQEWKVEKVEKLEEEVKSV
jgi:hypothetical protein